MNTNTVLITIRKRRGRREFEGDLDFLIKHSIGRKLTANHFVIKNRLLLKLVRGLINHVS